MNVSGQSGQILDLDLTTFIRHTFAGDLDITLQSPFGTVVVISTDNGGSTDNVFNGTIWNDQVNIPVSDLSDPMLDVAMRLEEIALKDDYFVEKKLYPNVDFYSGIIYKALGIPTSMFTVMFAIGRAVGWCAHWREMITDPEGRIGRPRQLYTGPAKRDYTPVSKR